jgi:lysophospholipase L1-like esterase
MRAAAADADADREEAARKLRQAADLAGQLAAQPLQQQIGQLARRARIQLPGPGSHSVGAAAVPLGLTGREQEVLQRLGNDGRAPYGPDAYLYAAGDAGEFGPVKSIVNRSGMWGPVTMSVPSDQARGLYYIYASCGDYPSGYYDYVQIPATGAALAYGLTAITVGDSYVALGDSFSSGEGGGNYLLGTDATNDHCHRSLNAYPELLDQSKILGVLDFVSCSGAITDDFFNANNEGNHEPAQSQALSSTTKYVTLTFGGNDLGFADVLTKCIYAKFLGAVIYGKPGCSQNTSLTSAVIQRLHALAGTAKATTPGGAPIHSIASILSRIRPSVHTAAVPGTSTSPEILCYGSVPSLLLRSRAEGFCGSGSPSP